MLTVGFVILVVGLLLLMGDVRDLMASVSDIQFRIDRLERKIFEGRPPQRLARVVYPNKWKPWAR